MSPNPAEAIKLSRLRVRPTGNAWDFPLSKGDKALRLVKLFEAEVEHCHQELRQLASENEALRRPRAPAAASGASSCGSCGHASASEQESDQECTGLANDELPHRCRSLPSSSGTPAPSARALPDARAAPPPPPPADAAEAEALFGCKTDDEDQLVVLEYLTSAAKAWQQTAEVRAQELNQERARLERFEQSHQEEAVAHAQGKSLTEMQDDARKAEAKVKELEEQLASHQRRELELSTSLALLREFGHEEFMQRLSARGPRPPSDVPHVPRPRRASCAGAPPPVKERQPDRAETDRASAQLPSVERQPDRASAKLPSVLISVELDLGFSVATLQVAPWQSREDFGDVVGAFLEQHRVRPVFAEALVRYLEEVEGQATNFPVMTQARLADLFSLYG